MRTIFLAVVLGMIACQQSLGDMKGHSVPESVKEVLQQRADSLSRITYVWQVEWESTIPDCKNALLRCTIVRYDNFMEVSVNAEKAPPDRGHLLSWYHYYAPNYALRVTPFLPGVATVYPTPEPSIAYIPYVSKSLYEQIPQDYVFLAGLNPLQIMGAEWHVIREEGDNVVLACSYRHQTVQPDANLEVKLSKKDGFSLSMELHSEHIGHKRALWKTEKEILWRGYRIPSEVSFERIPNDSELPSYRIHYKLVRIEATRAVPRIQINATKPVTVNDFRLIDYEELQDPRVPYEQKIKRVPLYHFEGELLSQEALRKLALEQGVPLTTRSPSYLSMRLLPLLGIAILFVIFTTLYLRRRLKK